MSSEPRHRRRAALVGTGSSGGQALVGAVAVGLSIAGLAGTAPGTLAALCAVVLGIAVLFESGALLAYYGEAQEELQATHQRGAVMGSVVAEGLLGLAAVILGAIALLGVADGALVEIGVLVLATALLLGGGLVTGTALVTGAFDEDRSEHRLGRVVAGTGSLEGIVGASAMVIGVLALIGVGRDPVLALVGYLLLGAAELITGLAVAARFGRLSRPDREPRHPRGPGGRISEHQLHET